MSGENKNPKGYNNHAAWDKVESKSPETKNLGSIDEESIYARLIDESEDIGDGDVTIEDEIPFMDCENFDDDIIKLSPFSRDISDNNQPNDVPVGLVAEYHEIEVVEIQQRHLLKAREFVGKISKFVKEFKDIELSDQQKSYLDNVCEFQITQLSELMYIVEVNKKLLDNMIYRINLVQAEDYVMLNTYNSLVNQHIKLFKELNSTYKNVPMVLKKMRTEIMCDQELIGDGDKSPITDGITQAKNGKNLHEMLTKRLEQKKLEQSNKEENGFTN